MNPCAIRFSNYRPDIDGLRALAIVPVVLFHANVTFLSGGFVGVDVFFVISGFLIGSLVYREIAEGRFSIRIFYERRAKRIIPALLVMILICYFPACILLSGAELKEFGYEVLSTVISSSNFYFARVGSDYFTASAENHPLLMTWSLGVEEQFYIFFPLLMALLIRYARRYILAILGGLTLVSFIIAIIALPRFSAPTFYLLPTRAWELGLGAMLGIHLTIKHNETQRQPVGRKKEIESVLGVALLSFAILRFNRDTFYPGWATLIPTIAAVLLIHSNGSWVNRKLLASKPLVALGLVSYSWYLWHWPIMSFARVTMAGQLPIQIGLAISVLSLFLAVPSYLLVEQRFRRPSKTVSPFILWRYGITTSVVALPACLFLVLHGWPTRYSNTIQVDELATSSRHDLCLVSYGKTQFIDSDFCVNHDQSVPTVALLGDSHAAALAPYLRKEAASWGWRLDQITKASCPPLGYVSRYLPTRLHHDVECSAFNQRALQFVIHSPNVRTVILEGYWTAPFPEHDDEERFVRMDQPYETTSVEQSWTNFRFGLSQTAQILQSHGIRVLILRDWPRWPFDPMLASRTKAIPARSWLNTLLHGPDESEVTRPLSSLLQNVDATANGILSSVAAQSNSTLIDPAQGLCPSGGCYFEQQLLPLYVDVQHLSPQGAALALRNVNIFK